jgi:hypothetical protein
MTDGSLVRSRVVADPGDALATALDRTLTGYAALEPQSALLLDGDDRGVFVLSDGVPVAARHDGTGRRGADAVADLAGPGPFRVELYEASPPDRDRFGPLDPGTPADLLADDPALADRLRAAAPESAGTDAGGSLDAVEAFLADEERIEAIREHARAEAERRAEEWDIDV